MQAQYAGCRRCSNTSTAVNMCSSLSLFRYEQLQEKNGCWNHSRWQANLLRTTLVSSGRRGMQEEQRVIDRRSGQLAHKKDRMADEPACWQQQSNNNFCLEKMHTAKRQRAMKPAQAQASGTAHGASWWRLSTTWQHARASDSALLPLHSKSTIDQGGLAPQDDWCQKGKAPDGAAWWQ